MQVPNVSTETTIAIRGSASETATAAHAPDGLGQNGRRQVVIAVLATAIVDLLLEKHACVRGKHEARTC
jgi:hypothetical protein